MPEIDPSLIKELLPADADRMRRFLVSVFGPAFDALAEKHLRAAFTADDSSSLVFLACWIDGEIVGACAISEPAFTCGTWGLGWVGVEEKRRRQGIGSGLARASMRAVAKRIPSRATLLLSVVPALVPFYEKLGFQGSTSDHDGNPFLSRAIDPIRPWQKRSSERGA